MSIFNSVEMQPDDPILGLGTAFKADQRASKINLGVGAYKNSEGVSQVLSCVRKAENIILEKKLNKDYLPILGNYDYIQESLKLIFGENSPALVSEVISAAQTIGATGALRVGGDFLFRNQISDTIFLSDPSWQNHKAIFRNAGMKIDIYPYFDLNSYSLNYSGMRESIKKMPPGSVILLQPCCHNPTGLDPSFDQWKELSQIILQQKLIPFFDFAYQGFGQGLAEDAKVVRYFADVGHEMLVASSYSKNFGIYGERVGLLSIVCKDHASAVRTGSQLKQIIRGSYSMPPLQGQRIVTEILQSKELREKWVHELDNMRSRIKEMRKALLSGLQAKAGDSEFKFLEKQTGMFSFSGLNEDQVNHLMQDFGIYMPKNGRINVAGLNTNNMDYFIESFLSVI